MNISHSRKIAAAALIAIGLVTFLEPMISTDPPTIGRARWSLMDIANSSYEGQLPRDADNTNLWILSAHFGLIYVLLIVSAASLCFFPLQRLLLWAGVIGAITALETLRWGQEMKSLFYGNPMLYGGHTSGRVNYGGLTSLLFIAMVLIFFSAAKATSPAQRGKRRPRWRLKSVKQEIREDDH